MNHIYIISTALVLGAMHRCNSQTVETVDVNPTITPKGSTEETEVPADGHASGAHEHDGAALYSRYCALCHGEDREGYAADEAPSLRSAELMGSASGSYLWSSISYGRPGTAMAAFEDTQGGPLSHDGQHALLDWLMEQSGVEWEPIEDTPVLGDPAIGAEIYDTHCAQCHGSQGEGGTGTALANPVFLATASDSFNTRSRTDAQGPRWRGTPRS